MIKVPVYNQKGEKKEELQLPSEIFAVQPDVALLEQAVRVQLANKRTPVASTKTRSEVRGGGRKPWRQKGTGRARHGSIRSPLWAGGGITFGPSSNRNWSLKMNKPAKRTALRMALSDKVNNNQFAVVDNLTFDEDKTKVFAQWLADFTSKINGLGKEILIVLPRKSEELYKISRNIPQVQTILASSLNVYDILKSDSMIVLADSVQVITKTYSK